MEIIKHANFTEINFNVNYQGEEYRIKITDSNDHKENMMLFLRNDIISWSVSYDERASKSMRRVLAQHNYRLLNNLVRGQISKFNRTFAY